MLLAVDIYIYINLYIYIYIYRFVNFKLVPSLADQSDISIIVLGTKVAINFYLWDRKALMTMTNATRVIFHVNNCHKLIANSD